MRTAKSKSTRFSAFSIPYLTMASSKNTTRTVNTLFLSLLISSSLSLILSLPLSFCVAFSNRAEFIVAGHDGLSSESCPTSVEIYVLETFVAVRITNSPMMPVCDGEDKGEGREKETEDVARRFT